ncbi:MAG: amidohydrolase family protein [Oscillospiraceae bacterium]|nr:amidohydrolase family protein [Oscillospiraceae bacterium]
MESFVIKGDICYSKSYNELVTCENGYLVCVDGKSCGVFDVLPEEYASLPVTDYGDALIFPGLVDLHIHASQYSYRGLGMDLELLDWLEVQAFPEESKYADLEYAKKSYTIFAEQMRKSATSRVSMFATCHREATELLMELMEETGLVSYVGKVNMDREAPDTLRETTEASADETARWIENTAEKFKNTKPIITPRFVPSCTDELMVKLRDIQTKYGTAVQSHVSENLGEIEFVHQLRPNNKFYGEVYDEHNMFGLNHHNGSDVKTIMAHCIWSCDEEIEMMKKQNVFVVHCPASNTNVVAGIAPIRKYIEAGLKIGLGSDVAGGQTESMLRAVTDAIQVSKLRWRLIDQNDKPLTFAESFYIATKGGGEFFGKVGSFEEGYEFDAVILDDSHCPHPQELTVAERLERAAYLSADLSGVKAKYVAGKKVY